MVASTYGGRPQIDPQSLVAGALKQPPAPGQSPVGGTTSLPQNLQAPGTPAKAGGMTPGAPSGGLSAPQQGTIGGTMPGAVAPAAPVPASTPPGTVPPAPPPAPPAAAPGAPATPGTGNTPEDQAMHDTLYKKLMEQISNPSRYDAATAAARTQGMQNLNDTRLQATDRMNATMASRGLFASSPAANALGTIESQMNRGQGDLEAGLVKDEAAHRHEDMQSAINNILQYGQQGMISQQQKNELMLKMIELGYMGGPDQNMGLPPLPGA